MTQTLRLCKLKEWLDAGRCLTRDFLLRELEVSPATVKRDLALLRDQLNMPLAWDRTRRGWRLDASQTVIGPQYELPGPWFTAEEIHALLTMQHLLANLDAGGLLGPHIEPLKQRLARIMGTGAAAGIGLVAASAEVARRIRVFRLGSRPLQLPHFQAVSSAVLRRQRVVIGYRGRGSGQASEREVSPQRLVHYRDNWYLDAWCHLRSALRSFSVDAITSVRVLDRLAIELPDSQLDAELGAGYGIFAGREVQWATLRFSAERARWVAAETWHPKQRAHWDTEGRWVLTLPYADPRELVMDILRHVPEVEVIEPAGLREAVRKRLVAGVKKFSAGSSGEP